MKYTIAILGSLAFAVLPVAPHGLARTALAGSSSAAPAGESVAAGGGCTNVHAFAPANNTDLGVWYLSTVTGAGQVSTIDLTNMGGDLETNQPLPTGAALLETFGDNQDRANAGLLNEYGQPDDIFPTLVIEYSWHKASNPGQNLTAAPTLKLAFFNPVCDDPLSAGDCFGQLIYEPAWNGPGATSPNGPSTNPPLDTWTSATIDENNGLFWWTGGFGEPSSGGGPPVRTLAEWRALLSSDFGDSQLFLLEIGVGSFNQNQVGYFDDVRISHSFGDGFDMCYDFEASLDCNGNGIPDEQDIANGTSQDCDGDGVPDECQIADDPSLDLNGNGILDACECLVSSYCIANPNSTNLPGKIGATGIPSLSLNSFVLSATQLPSGVPGVFFFGPLQIAPFPFGDGYRCVGGTLLRLNPPLFIDGQGTAQRQLDFTQSPTDTFSAGDTMNFQFLYRDPQQVGEGFNLTDALVV